MQSAFEQATCAEYRDMEGVGTETRGRTAVVTRRPDEYVEQVAAFLEA